MAVPPIVGSLDFVAKPAQLVIADVRWYLDGRSGASAYATGHIPGAVFVDLDRWLAGPASPAAGRHPLPDPIIFAEGMGSLGISDTSVVIAYDDAGGTIAARLIWMLRALGQDAALLDGGLSAWYGPLEVSAPTIKPCVFPARPWPPSRLATIAEAQAPNNLVIDARAPERYAGIEEPVDPRAGHIPGARSLPCRENLGADGRFLIPDALLARFKSIGAADPATTVVSYCGSGVTACQNLLALEFAGLEPGKLYPGSWSQYCSDPTRPIATGAQ